MSEIGAGKEEHNGNSALDWEIFDILCRDELGLSVSSYEKTVSVDLGIQKFEIVQRMKKCDQKLLL